MKKSLVSLFTITTIALSVASCSGGKKAKEDTAKAEEAAIAAGNIPKNLLTEELKTETIRLLNDLPDSEIPYRISTGEVKIGVGNMKYMLPAGKAAELTSMSQKARACGMFFADYNVLALTGQPTAETEGVLARLTTDLNVSYLLNVLKERSPENASKEQVQSFYLAQEKKIVKALADDNKIHIAIEMLGGAAAEYSCLMANPSLVVKGDATSAGLTENMEKRLNVLTEITSDLSVYYPEMKSLGEAITPLRAKVSSIQAAREANAEITAIRDRLLN